MAIPKIIHYCWFGSNPLPKEVEKYIESWRKTCPDYEIKEWNETNFDVHCCQYVEEAYIAKKWAFVSDYARFMALYKEGGIYFDTDIETLKSFDDLLNDGAFFGFGWETLTLPVFGASKGLNCLKLILDYYNTRSFIKPDGEYDLSPIENSALKILQEQYGLVLNGKYQRLKENIVIYPREYFCSTKWNTGQIYKNSKLYVIHYADASWFSEEEKKSLRMRRRVISFLGNRVGSFIDNILFLIRKDGLAGLMMHAHCFFMRNISPAFMKTLSALYVNKNKIVFENFAGRGYGDNPKYIAEELISRNLKYDLVWIVNKDASYKFPKEIRTVHKGTYRELYELATSGYWIDNSRKVASIIKNPKQKYIQTWHGFYPLKKIEKDAIDTLPSTYIQSAIHDGKMTDLMMSGCKARTEIYRSSFWYDGEIKEWGTPRNDIFFKDYDFKQEICKFFKLDIKSKLLLYAPTFRDNRSVSAYNLNFENVIEALNHKFGGDWKVLIRLHPVVREKSDFINYSNQIIDASTYDDIQELFAASDLLISDYSDCMFEFSLTKKPVLLYASDLDEYSKGRSFYYDIHTLPYSLAENNEELLNQIEKFDYDVYLIKLNAFFNQIGVLEKGIASKSVVDYILNNR